MVRVVLQVLMDIPLSLVNLQDSLNDALLRMIIFIQIIQVIKLCQMPFLKRINQTKKEWSGE